MTFASRPAERALCRRPRGGHVGRLSDERTPRRYDEPRIPRSFRGLLQEFGDAHATGEEVFHEAVLQEAEFAQRT